MAYRLGTIGGLFDGQPLPLDSSWLPPELRNVPTLPDGTPIIPPQTPPAPPPEAPPFYASPGFTLFFGLSVGLVAGYMQWGRR